jgi:hypothetical protein
VRELGDVGNALSVGEFELEAPDRDAATAGMTAWGNNTDMEPSYDSTPTF